jgi:hypothetical protein
MRHTSRDPSRAAWCRRPGAIRPCLARAAILAMALLAVPAGAVAPPDAATLFGGERVVPVTITLPADDWETLRRESRDASFLFSASPPKKFTWFKGAADVDGHAAAEVGIRKKGFLGSLDSARPSLIVDYGKGSSRSPFTGIGRITLNNNKQDAACIGQFLAYELFRAAGVPTPRVGFAAVTVNGAPLGVYTHVESIKKPFLERVFGDDDGGLYEGTVTDLLPGALGKFEVETHDRFTARLETLAALLAADEPLDEERINALVDIDTFLSYWAVEALAGIWDGYTANQNNYFVHVSATDERLRFIPWGTDSAFTSLPGPFMAFQRRVPPAIHAEGALANRLAFVPGMAERYRRRLTELLATVWSEERLLGEVDRLESLLTPHFVPAQAGAKKALVNVRDFIRRRRGELEPVLADWPPALPTRPRPPLSTKRVGTVSGTFATLQRLAADEEAAPGEVTLSLTLNDAPVAVTTRDVRAYPTPLPGPGGRPGPAPGQAPVGPPQPAPPPAGAAAAQGDQPIGVTVSGARDDGTPLTITFLLDRRLVRDTTTDLEAGGLLAIGGGFLGTGPMRVLGGRVALTERGVAPGSRLAGSFSFTVDETSGGFNNPAPRARPPAAAPAPER